MQNQVINKQGFSFVQAYAEWLSQLISTNINKKGESAEIQLKFPDGDNPINAFFQEHPLPDEQKLTVLVLLLNYYSCELLLPFLQLFTNEQTRGLIGGRLCEHTKLYEPSLQTMVFLLSGNKPDKKIIYTHKLEEANNQLFCNGIIEYKYPNDSGIKSSIVLTDVYRNALMGNSGARLDSGSNFPARLASTPLSFDEVVLSSKTQEDLAPLMEFLRVRKDIMGRPELRKRVKTCFLTVFSGFPGTGKTVAAKTIGKMFGMETYTLELSRVVSKYIGEFEKSIDKVLTRFSGKNCILLIDEADAIFTKRLENISDAKDKYINQEMAYLLQRLEEYEGVIILASNVANFKQQVDNAMLRRIRNIVQFPFPLCEERKRLWKNALPSTFAYEDKLIERLAENFQLTGASIYNIVSELIVEVVGKNIETVSLECVKPFLEADFRKRDITMRPCRDGENPQAVMGQRVGQQVMSTGKRM